MAILIVVVWSAATVIHVLLSARAVLRVLDRSGAVADERVFGVVLFSTASLSCVLHVVSITVGLSLANGLGGLVLWHAALWWAGRRSAASTAAPPPRMTLTEVAGAAVLVGLSLTWIDHASAFAETRGPDAAHYHVPYAVNLAHGLSPFALPATPHLYPMAGSMMSAWFLVPVGGSLLVDLPQLLAFLLAASGLQWLFRLMTGLSGLAWGVPLVLLLFSTPLFRGSSQGAADLWFAAAFISVVAVLVNGWTRGEWRLLDWWLLGGAVGLLVGSKTTGVPSGVLLLGVFSGASILRWWFQPASRPVQSWRGLAARVAIAVAVALGAGGVWLVRNWFQFGSPLAPTGLVVAGVSVFSGVPFQQTTYLSVLGDWRAGGYDLMGRMRAFVATWYGPWFLPALLPLLALAGDLVTATWSGRRGRTRSARLMAGVLVITTGSVLVWMLGGAPWTSLEWTRGFSLRYALPLAALLLLLACVGLFPLTWRWYDHRTGRAAAWVAWAALGSAAFLQSLDASRAQYVDVPGLHWGWALAGVAGVLLARRGASAWERRRTVVILSLAATLAWAPAIASRGERARQREAERQAGEQSAFAAGVAPASGWREVYLGVRAFEQANGRTCSRQRFFALARFDEPLSLQTETLRNDVFYAGRDVAAARAAGPIGPCDYVITTHAVADTEKGRALERALLGDAAPREVATTLRFIVRARDERR